MGCLGKELADARMEMAIGRLADWRLFGIAAELLRLQLAGGQRVSVSKVLSVAGLWWGIRLMGRSDQQPIGHWMMYDDALDTPDEPAWEFWRLLLSTATDYDLFESHKTLALGPRLWSDCGHIRRPFLPTDSGQSSLNDRMHHGSLLWRTCFPESGTGHVRYMITLDAVSWVLDHLCPDDGNGLDLLAPETASQCGTATRACTAALEIRGREGRACSVAEACCDILLARPWFQNMIVDSQVSVSLTDKCRELANHIAWRAMAAVRHRFRAQGIARTAIHPHLSTVLVDLFIDYMLSYQPPHRNPTIPAPVASSPVGKCQPRAAVTGTAAVLVNYLLCDRDGFDGVSRTPRVSQQWEQMASDCPTGGSSSSPLNSSNPIAIISATGPAGGEKEHARYSPPLDDTSPAAVICATGPAVGEHEHVRYQPAVASDGHVRPNGREAPADGQIDPNRLFDDEHLLRLWRFPAGVKPTPSMHPKTYATVAC
jgi:hypothetical protein